MSTFWRLMEHALVASLQRTVAQAGRPIAAVWVQLGTDDEDPRIFWISGSVHYGERVPEHHIAWHGDFDDPVSTDARDGELADQSERWLRETDLWIDDGDLDDEDRVTAAYAAIEARVQAEISALAIRAAERGALDLGAKLPALVVHAGINDDANELELSIASNPPSRLEDLRRTVLLRTPRPARTTAIVLTCLLALSTVALAQAAIRTARVSGDGRGGLSFVASATDRTGDRWCATVRVARLSKSGEGSTYEGDRGCGSTRDESVLALTFACPYGLGIAAFTHGIPDRVVITYSDGRRARVKTKTGRGQSGRSTLFAAAIPESQLPALVERVDDGRRATITKLSKTATVCDGPDG